MKSEKQRQHLQKLADMKRGVPSPLKGKSRPSFSQAWKDNIRKAAIGRMVSASTRSKMSASQLGRRHTIESRIKMSQHAKKGSAHYMWRNGATILHNKLRSTLTYKNWRRCIFERDKYSCVFCSVTGGTLHADHIKPLVMILNENRIKSTEDALECQELWDLNNGRTLCVSCHRKTDTYGIKVRQYLHHG